MAESHLNLIVMTMRPISRLFRAATEEHLQMKISSHCLTTASPRMMRWIHRKLDLVSISKPVNCVPGSKFVGWCTSSWPQPSPAADDPHDCRRLTCCGCWTKRNHRSGPRR